MSNPTEFKEKCSAIERCLPVSDFRVQVAQTHNAMLDRITSLKAERDQARLAAAMECLRIAISNGDDWQICADIRQHFGITDHIVNVNKMVDGGEP